MFSTAASVLLILMQCFMRFGESLGIKKILPPKGVEARWRNSGEDLSHVGDTLEKSLSNSTFDWQHFKLYQMC